MNQDPVAVPRSLDRQRSEQQPRGISMNQSELGSVIFALDEDPNFLLIDSCISSTSD